MEIKSLSLLDCFNEQVQKVEALRQESTPSVNQEIETPQTSQGTFVPRTPGCPGNS